MSEEHDARVSKDGKETPPDPMSEDERAEIRKGQRSGDATPWRGDLPPSGETDDTPERPA